MTTVERDRTARTRPTAGPPVVTGPATGPVDDPALFRFPLPDDPAPGTLRLLTMSLYAAALGLTAAGVGLCATVTVLGGAAFWYVPVLTFFGLLGVTLVVGSFLAIHRPVLPWLLLLAATVPLTVDVLIAALY